LPLQLDDPHGPCLRGGSTPGPSWLAATRWLTRRLVVGPITPHRVENARQRSGQRHHSDLFPAPPRDSPAALHGQRCRLHTPTLRQLERIPYEVLGRLIEKKLSKRAIEVSPKQRQRIVDHFVAGGRLDAVPFEMPDDQPNRVVRLSVTEDEGTGMLRTADAVLGRLPTLLDSEFRSDHDTTARKRTSAY
jgi:hypothetical protein